MPQKWKMKLTWSWKYYLMMPETKGLAIIQDFAAHCAMKN
jgi:hypothetical protein